MSYDNSRRNMDYGMGSQGYNDANVRLVNGGSRYEGRLEVYHDGQWGTVCQDRWDERDAEVVCRSLGLGAAIGMNNDRNEFGEGMGPIWMTKVECRGDESSLTQCMHEGWGVDYGCDHSKDVGVMCRRSMEFEGRAQNNRDYNSGSNSNSDSGDFGDQYQYQTTTAMYDGGNDFGWDSIPGLANKYRFVSDEAYYDAATEECHAWGGYLVEITSEKENRKIKEHAMNVLPYDVFRGVPDDLWIGVNDKEREDQFRYEHSGYPITFNDWAREEETKSSFRQKDHDCATMNRLENWRTRNCQEPAQGFICERDP